MAIKSDTWTSDRHSVIPPWFDQNGRQPKPNLCTVSSTKMFGSKHGRCENAWRWVIIGVRQSLAFGMLTDTTIISCAHLHCMQTATDTTLLSVLKILHSRQLTFFINPSVHSHFGAKEKHMARLYRTWMILPTTLTHLPMTCRYICDQSV